MASGGYNGFYSGSGDNTAEMRTDWVDFLPGRRCFSGPAPGKDVSIRPGIFFDGSCVLCGMLLLSG